MRWRRIANVGAALGVTALLVFTVRVVMEFRGEAAPATSPAATPERIARGQYLTRAGNCMACHTARGGVPFAGGSGIPTPFGTVFTSNLTPDRETGLGAWSAADFWQSLHHGRSRSGRLLYPAFPYTNTTLVRRDDADAMFVYLQSLAPVKQPNRPHELRFPYDTQAALAVWRALYFRPAEYRDDTAQSAEWNRGAYLVQGLGHCNACHASRNALGATSNPLALGGGLIPMQNWYAPALNAAHEAGVADWSTAQVAELLKNGVSSRGSVIGPMAEVVLYSTQYLGEADLNAMAVYLKALPQQAAATTTLAAPNADRLAVGAKLYGQHCAACHGERGEGAPGVYPALAGNRTVTMAQPVNLVRVVLGGGFAPATAGNPRPYGMPPFAALLADDDVAALLSYLRSAWGHQASPLTSFDVNRHRSGAAGGS